MTPSLCDLFVLTLTSPIMTASEALTPRSFSAPKKNPGCGLPTTSAVTPARGLTASVVLLFQHLFERRKNARRIQEVFHLCANQPRCIDKFRKKMHLVVTGAAIAVEKYRKKNIFFLTKHVASPALYSSPRTNAPGPKHSPCAPSPL